MIQRINKDGAKSAKLPNPCKHCGTIGHSAFNCHKKPKKPLNRVKRMKKIGRMGQKLIDQRREYLKAFPAPHYCYYCLYIGIEEELPEPVIQVEHFMTKNNRQDLRFDWSNLVKACPPHNEMKGSINGDKFLEILDKMRRN